MSEADMDQIQAPESGPRAESSSKQSIPWSLSKSHLGLPEEKIDAILPERLRSVSNIKLRGSAEYAPSRLRVLFEKQNARPRRVDCV